MTSVQMHRRAFIGSAIIAASIPAMAAKLPALKQPVSSDGVTLVIRDLSPRFLDFYAAAQGLAPDERFRIWKERYDFAAVPPTPAGDAIARKLLDAAWPRYAAALPSIRAGEKGMQPAALPAAVKIADLLQAPRPISIGLTTYVGGFEDNAFTNDTGEGPIVCVPLEIDQSTRAMLFPHEMTHAVHGIVAKLSPGYERSLGRVIFEEGLAMRTVQRVHIGLADYRYVGKKPWFDAAMDQRRRIMAALLPNLDARDAGTILNFTMGSGATGREREAYVAGWLVVGELLAQGATLPELARVPEAELPQTVRQVMVKLVGA